MALTRMKTWLGQLGRYIFWKEVLDRLLALLALVVLSPLMILVALLIVIDSPGGALFRQERVGKGGRIFTLYKFRSMYRDHDDSRYREYMKRYVLENITSPLDENGQDVYGIINDPRVTRIGSLIRRTSIDELPQLINVLKGDMSFVGPRPDIPFVVSLYKEHHRARLQVKPGITGLWQVTPGRRLITFNEVVRLDVDYINRQSFLLDLKIMILTVREMVATKGIEERENITDGMQA